MTRSTDAELQRTERVPNLLPGSAGHLLVTEPQNLLQQRFEEIERGHEELEEGEQPMSNAACIRCGEPLVDSSRPCGFCTSEIRHNAVAVLVATRGESDMDKYTRVIAAATLRALGHSQEEVVHARARAFDGHSVEQILEGLCGDERERVAA
jgi:hypothetical protein